VPIATLGIFTSTPSSDICVNPSQELISEADTVYYFDIIPASLYALSLYRDKNEPPVDYISGKRVTHWQKLRSATTLLCANLSQ